MPDVLAPLKPFLGRAFTYACIEIFMGEDWNDPFFLTEAGRPMDLTGMRLELICRPTFDHPTLIIKLSSDSAEGGAIVIEDPLKGACAIVLPWEAVNAIFVPGRWKQFMRLLDDSVSVNPPVTSPWQGDLIVHPGRVR